MDGSLATIAKQLKTMINGLINKIDKQEPYALDMSELFATKKNESQ